MALDYELNSSADYSEKDIVELLQSLGLERYKNENVFNGKGIHCVFDIYNKSRPHSPVSQEIINKNFGFVPTFVIFMNIDKFENHEEGLMNVIRVANLLLTKNESDVVLLFNGEYVYLLRKDSQLYLNSTHPLTWKPELRKILQLPYKEKSFSLVP